MTPEATMFDPTQFESEMAALLTDDAPTPSEELADELADDELADELADEELSASWNGAVDAPAAAFEERSRDDHELIGDGDHDAELEAELEVELACRYLPGEIALSRSAQGLLPIDTFTHGAGLAIADFGVARRSPKPLVLNSAPVQMWLARLGTAYKRLEVVGYSDCVGAEATNTRLRMARARAVIERLPLHLKHEARALAAPLGEYLAGNRTPGERAMNRGVVLRVGLGVAVMPDDQGFTGRRRSWDLRRDGDPIAWILRGAHPPKRRPTAQSHLAFATRLLKLAEHVVPLDPRKLARGWFEILFAMLNEARAGKALVLARSDYTVAYATAWVTARRLWADQPIGIPDTREGLLAALARVDPSATLAVNRARVVGTLDAVNRMSVLLAAGGPAMLGGLLRTIRARSLPGGTLDEVDGVRLLSTIADQMDRYHAP